MDAINNQNQGKDTDLLLDKIKRLKELNATYQREFATLFAEKDRIISRYLKDLEVLKIRDLEESIKNFSEEK